MRQKILIVDDEESIVTLLTYNLEQAGFMTDSVYNGKDAVNQAQKHLYDLIILDLMLPELDGLEVCKRLRQKRIDTPILMLTAKDDEVDKIVGLEVGADDYLTKPFSPREIIARIRAILRRTRQTKHNDELLKVGELTIFPERYEVIADQKKIEFTRKEFELLYYLALNEGIVLERDRLLQEIWDYSFAGDTRIVDVHISRLREKLADFSYIKTVHGLGYKLEVH